MFFAQINYKYFYLLKQDSGDFTFAVRYGKNLANI